MASRQFYTHNKILDNIEFFSNLLTVSKLILPIYETNQ